MSSDQQPRQSIDTLVGQAIADVEQTLRHLIDAIVEQTAVERAAVVDAAVADARTEAQRAAEAQRAEADARVARVREEADARVAQVREEVEARVAQLRDEHEAGMARLRDESREEADRRVEDAVAAAMAEANTAIREAELDARRRAAEARLEGEAETASAYGTALEQARAEAARAASEVAETERAARGRERESMLGEFERLRDAIAALDSAASLKDCLDRLADGTALHAPRSLVLVVRGGALRGWRVTGFASAPSADSIALSLESAGPLRDVVERGEGRQLSPDAFGEATDAALAFARLASGRAGLAVPVTLSGRTVAVVYGDDGEAAEREVPTGWPEALDVLARHASRCLEALTAARSVAMLGATGGPGAFAVPPRTHQGGQPSSYGGVPGSTASPGSETEDWRTAAERYARLVVSEIRLYNEAAIRVGRENRDLRARLRAEIDRARRLYHERVPESLAGRDDVFERELVRVLADGQPDLLGAPTHDVA